MSWCVIPLVAMVVRGAKQPGATPQGMVIWWQYLVVASWVEGFRGIEALGMVTAKSPPPAHPRPS